MNNIVEDVTLSDTEEMDESDGGESDGQEMYFIPQRTAISTAPSIPVSHVLDTEESGNENDGLILTVVDSNGSSDVATNTFGQSNQPDILHTNNDLEATSDSDISIISNVYEFSRTFYQRDENSTELPHSQNEVEVGQITTIQDNELRSDESVKLEKSQNVNDASIRSDEEESATNCSICLEPWSNMGAHRIVSLKCGHLFGKSCIEQWLKGSKASSKCPQCNAKASIKDLRVIYAKCVKVEDRAERQRLLEEIDKLRKQNHEYEKERAIQKMKSHQDNKFIQELQRQLQMLRESTSEIAGNASGSTVGFGKKYKLGLFQSIDISRSGSCRVMAFNQWMNMLVLSSPSQIEMFSGFGIKKINTLDFKVENFYHLHSKQIRDLAFNPVKEDLLLSVAFDKVAKVTNVASNATVVSYTADSPLWSCCWSRTQSGHFFVGTASGQVLHFDTVNDTENSIKSYTVKGTGPVVSLHYVSANIERGFCCSGLLVTRLNSITFEELTSSSNNTHELFIDGNFTHAAFDSVSMHLLVTCRPNDRNHHVKHKIYALRTTYNENERRNIAIAQEIHSFQGSTTLKVIERNCLTTTDEGKTLLAIFNEESTNSVKVCDVSFSSPIQTIKPGANIIDILPFKGSDGDYVAMLSEKSLKTYKWINRI